MFFVFYERGSCNDGDHTAELEQFETEAAAEAYMKENEHYDATMTLIRGSLIRYWAGDLRR